MPNQKEELLIGNPTLKYLGINIEQLLEQLVTTKESGVPDKIPSTLPADRGVRHEIELVPGSKYCITRQWPLPT